MKIKWTYSVGRYMCDTCYATSIEEKELIHKENCEDIEYIKQRRKGEEAVDKAYEVNK